MVDGGAFPVGPDVEPAQETVREERLQQGWRKELSQQGQREELHRQKRREELLQQGQREELFQQCHGRNCFSRAGQWRCSSRAGERRCFGMSEGRTAQAGPKDKSVPARLEGGAALASQREEMKQLLLVIRRGNCFSREGGRSCYRKV